MSIPNWSRARRIVRRLRFTLVIGAVMVTLQLLPVGLASHRRVVQKLALNWPTFVHGEVWRVFTNVVVQITPGLRWSIMIPFLWVGVTEWHLGWKLTAVAFFVTDAVSTLGSLVVLRLVSVHSAWAMTQLTALDGGSSAAIYGTLGAFCGSRRGRNAWIAPVLLVQSMITIWLTNRRLFDVQHLGAIAVGLLIGFATSLESKRSTRSDRPHGTPPESESGPMLTSPHGRASGKKRNSMLNILPVRR